MALVDKIDRDALTGFLTRALAYPSPQTDRLEDDPRMAAFLREVVLPEARALDPDTVRTDAMGNLLAQWGRGTPALALAVYAMTHPQTTMPDAFSPTIVDGAAGVAVRGRGACEQKGAMAAVLAGLRALLADRGDLARPVALLGLTSGETGRPNAVRQLLDETGTTAELAIVACGTDNRVCLAQKGRLDVDILVRGRQSHSSTPWLGRNALEGAVTVLTRLAAHKVLGRHPTLGEVTLTPTALATEPRATHTVPALARVTVDRRLRPGEDPDAALAELRGLVGEVAPFEIEYEAGPYMYPYELAPDARLPRLIHAAHLAVAGRPAEPSYAHGGLDAGYLQHRGIEALMFGPGDTRLAHTANDLVRLDDCVTAAAVYAEVARAAAGGRPAA